MSDEAAAASPRWSALDLAEGLQLGHALSTLQHLGVLDALQRPRSTDDLAAEFGLDSALLTAALEFVAARSDAVDKRGRRFVRSASDTPESRFVTELYAGAFAANAVALPALLRRPARAGSTVDRVRHARAFLYAPGGAEQVTASLLAQLSVHVLLDLGCGPGHLLRAMAQQNPGFRGWGIDANPGMCRIARAGLRDAGASRRVRILQGDGRRPERVLPVSARTKIDAIVAGDLANELCAADGAAVAWLQRLRLAFPERWLLVSDYYGRLGHGREARRETLLHDYVQAISGQGIPPPDRKAWQALYRAAGVRLVHCIEHTSTTRFLHLLRI